MSDESCARKHNLTGFCCRNLFGDFADAVCELELVTRRPILRSLGLMQSDGSGLSPGFMGSSTGNRQLQFPWPDVLHAIDTKGLAPFFPQVLQLRLVVDADRVQGELRWRLQRRRNPAARSALHEAIDAGILVLFAPRYVIHEIEKHLGEIADETGTTVAAAKREWELFQGCLCFYSPRSSPSPIETYADINDFSYLATWSELDSQGVYTKDRHLAAMGAPVVSVLIDTHLREYARASTVQLAVKVGSSFSMIIGWEFLKIVYKLLVQCLRGICRLPPAAQIGLGAACVLSVTHPKSRAMLRDGWNAVANSQPFLQFCNAIVDLGLLAEEASLLAQSRHDYLKAAVPVRRPRPLLQHARAVCVEAGESLSLQELERRIRRGGYVSRSQTFRRYLRRVLASDASFVEVAAGHWTLHTPVSRA